MGAAIAAGSHAEKGIWALFVIVAKPKNQINSHIKWSSPFSDDHKKKLKLKFPKKSPIEANKRQSPTRFLKAVNIPALKDLLELK